jgi:DNA-directed RNA polymerase subunit E'/Rpb7
LKKYIPIELKKKLKKFDQVHQGVLTDFTSKFQVLYGGRGRIVDTSPFVQYTVRYSCLYAKPQIG